MAQPRNIKEVALTNHATNNFWFEVKPAEEYGADQVTLYSNTTVDFVFSFELTDALRDLNKMTVDAAGALLGNFALKTFVGGCDKAIFVKKLAAGAADQNITAIY